MKTLPFEQRQIATREHLLEQALAVFAGHGAVAIHQLGSLARGEGDALSDLDLWITFKDGALPSVTAQQEQIYAEVAEVLISYQALGNRPAGGTYRLVIYNAAGNLMQVDYYLAPRSTSVILPEGRLLYGDDSLSRGPWLLDRSASTPETIPERIDFLICMAFIGVKKVLRRDEEFIRFLSRAYLQFVETYHLGLIAIDYGVSFDTLSRMLQELRKVGDEQQRLAIDEIVDGYLRLLRRTYEEAS